MPRRVLQAVAAALAAAGALASSGSDEISLVQQEVHSIDSTDVENSLMGVFAHMLSAMQLEGVVREALEEAGADDAADVGQCSADDRDAMFAKVGAIAGKAQEAGPAGVMQAMMVEMEDCKNVLTNHIPGIPQLSTLSKCLGAFFQVSDRCRACGAGYFQSMLGIYGCTRACIPMMVQCKTAQEEGPSPKCIETSTRCMKCGHPKWRDFSKCMGGVPNTDKTLQAMDSAYDALAFGGMHIQDAVQEMISVVSSKSKEVLFHKPGMALA